jgi:carboxypeptidase Q
MNRFITILAVALLFILNSSALAQSNKVVKKIIEIGQTDNQTMKHLDILTNRFGGRLIGSDAYEN